MATIGLDKLYYRTCFEFLYLFGDSNYTGIKFE